jgi:YD repeat-containing protein
LTDGTGATYAYAVKSNRLTSVSGNGGTQGVGYTASGHINSIMGMNATALTYNQADRLAAVTAGDQPLSQYTYDAFGQRSYKSGAVTG